MPNASAKGSRSTVSTTVEVEADSVEEALEKVYDAPDMPGSIVHGAFGQASVDEAGGWHAYDPELPGPVGVFDGSPFPDGSVVSDLAWGRIDPVFAQRLLESDGVMCREALP